MVGNQTNISPEFIQKAARILKTLGHPDRIKIVEFLEDGEKTVGQIHWELDLQQPIVSQHLKVMNERGIVVFRRDGTRCYYSLASELIVNILNCLGEFQEKLDSGEWNLENKNIGKI